ncbi:MAG: DNA repair protein RecO C-terminal domain-containing protein, partial [Chloroflexi bacterium]|nr:DNA repair protein RecO C-terminal domain-containing protein [Chloroflexota bacterium]
CVACREEMRPEDQDFSSLQGGVVCPRCGPGRSDSRPVSLLALKSLRHIQRSTYEEASRLKPSVSVHQELESLLQEYLTYLLERKLNTPAVLRQLRQNQASQAGSK